MTNSFLRRDPVWPAAVEEPFRASDITQLHDSISGYQATPLIDLPGLARRLGVGRILVKDEAQRFGLKAFKALGASYAVFRFVRDYLKASGRSCPEAACFYQHADILRPNELVFCTATDGNHGRGVAWSARLLNQKAVIYMPSGTVPARIENNRREGAEVVLVDGTYDETVTRCAKDAQAQGWQVISDTSWPGYDQIPRWIMAGYLTLFREIEAAAEQGTRFDVVFVQSGVGALAAAAAWYFRRESRWPETKLVSVEPTEAACLLESIASPDAEPTLSRGRQNSIMAGLNCGLPSLVAWPLIKQGFDAFLAVDDNACVEAMRRYYYPVDSDPSVVAGESGAAGLAALLTLTQDSTLSANRSLLGLNRNATVLLLNTEGDTDPAGFHRRVIQSGRP